MIFNCLEPPDQILHRHVLVVHEGFDGHRDLVEFGQHDLQELPLDHLFFNSLT
jgi:hypothetical protein